MTGVLIKDRRGEDTKKKLREDEAETGVTWPHTTSPEMTGGWIQEGLAVLVAGIRPLAEWPGLQGVGAGLGAQGSPHLLEGHRDRGGDP